MEPKKDFKKFFQKMFDTPVEIQGVTLTPQELDRKNFITFVNNYKTAVFRSQEIQEKFSLDLWSWEDMFAKSLEGLISYSFTPESVEVILWYVYEHTLAEEEGDYIVTYGEDEYIIKTADDLYDLVLLLEKE
jgi:hypothetical protein